MYNNFQKVNLFRPYLHNRVNTGAIQNSTFGLSRPKYYDITNGKFSIYNSDNRYLFESCKLKDRLLFQKSIGEYQDFKEANSEISKVSIFIQLIIKYKLFRY